MKLTGESDGHRAESKVRLESKNAVNPASADEAIDGQPRNWLDAGSDCEGKFRFDGFTIIAGWATGDITANDSLFIAETAEVNADLTAASIVIAGKVRGDIRANERIELRSTAKVCGKLTSPSLIVHDGAELEGHCSIQSASSKGAESPVHRTEETAMAAFSFFITARQKAELRARGYDDAAVGKMKPAEAHKILGII
jgi:cytoskeletal protein CcmA (bactofilin family)